MSSSYWVADAEGRVLGPLPLETLTELVTAGRIRDVASVSRDGEQWHALAEVAEVARIFEGPEPAARRQEEAKKARALRAQLMALRNKPANEVLGVRVGATLEEHRTAFFSLAKRFHPARLPPGTHEDLRDACHETFQFLSDLMQTVEAQLKKPAEPQRPTRGDARAQVPPPARYEVEDFVGLTREGDNIQATIRINAVTASIFTEHHTVNFRNESVFLPTPHHLPLGTLLSISLIFDNARQIHSRGRVVWENVNETAKSKLGFGVRLLSLEKQDRQFIREYINGAPREPTSQER